MQQFSPWKVKLKPPEQFKNLKYRILGLDSPPKNLYASLESWSETDTINYLRQTRSMVRSIIQNLEKMSDLSQKTIEIPKIRYQLKNAPSIIQQLRSYVFSPSDSTDLITTLTQYDYGAKATTDINLFFYRLAKEGVLTSVDSLNRVIGYFIHTNDLQMARFLVNFMLSSSKKPDRATLHLLLAFQAHRIRKNPYPTDIAWTHPLAYTQNILIIMKQAGVMADVDTWNMCLRCMPLGFGKSFLVEEMDRRGIPLDSSSKAELAQVIATSRQGADDKQESYAKILHDVDSQDPAVLRVVIDNLLALRSEGNYNVLTAWEILEKNQDTSTETLNVFMKRFGGRRHLDWQFGILNRFNKDPNSWEYLLEGACHTREGSQKPVVIGTIIKQMERESVPMTSRAKYLARKAVRKYTSQLQDLGNEAFNELQENLAWSSCFVPKNEKLLATIGFSEGDCMPSVFVNLDHSRFSAIDRTDTEAARLILADDLSKGTDRQKLKDL